MDTRARSRIWTKRRLNALGYGTSYDQMIEILARHNPLGFDKSGTAKDECGGLVGALIPKLESMSDAHQLQFCLHDEFRKFFRLAAPADDDQCAKIGSELWQEWITFQHRRCADNPNISLTRQGRQNCA